MVVLLLLTSVHAHSCSKPLQNYLVFNDVEGVYTYAFEYEKKVTFQLYCF